MNKHFVLTLAIGVAVFTVAPTAGYALGAMELQSPPASQNLPITRHEFVRAMAKIKRGMSEKDVLAILGKPDDIRTRTDPGGTMYWNAREVWDYGTNGHLTFPTLGCVFINKDGKVGGSVGGEGEPPDPNILPEERLRPILRLLHNEQGYNAAHKYNPLHVIQMVNALQPMGKKAALAAIEEYICIHDSRPSWGGAGMFLLLRVLFDVPEDTGLMPGMFVGAPMPPVPENPKDFPRFPILIVDDVPLLLVLGYNGTGIPQGPEKHIKYFRENGQIRKNPLTPTNSPLGLLAAWEKKAGFLYNKEQFRDSGKWLIANQILNMLDNVYRRETDPYGQKFAPLDRPEEEWKSIVRDVDKLRIHWSREKVSYVFEDGTQLPDDVKLYRRHIWPLEGLSGEAELTIERQTRITFG